MNESLFIIVRIELRKEDVHIGQKYFAANLNNFA